MIYYFSLLNTNIKDFWSDKTVFGGAVVLMAPDESLMLFKCDFVRKRDDVSCSVFKIELEPNEFNKYTHNVFNRPRIKLANIIGNSSNSRFVTWTSLHNSDDFDSNVEESYHYYHFAVSLKEKLILTNGKDERVKSIRIRDILNDDRKTVEFPVFNEGLMHRPDGTIYYAYSVRLPDKYLESFIIGKASFVKVLYTSDSAMDNKDSVIAVMYRSINGPKGLKDSMGLEIGIPFLKNMWQPETNWLYKPFSLKPVESECNITIDIPKDFIPPYSVADVGAGILEDMRKMSMFESDKRVRIPEIKEIIFNKPATVVYWKDGTKTTVKCGKDESFDREKAVAMCFLKKMFKPSLNSHWLDVIHDAIQAADDKVAKAEADKAEKARIKAENIAKVEEAKRKKAEKKVKELQSEIQKLETKSLEEINSKTDKKEEIYYVKPPENLVVIDSDIKKNETKVNEFHEESPNPGKKNKIDQDLMLECIKEKLTIDEIAEMNSWDKAAVARMYYKITGTKPEKKPNTYSELDDLFEQGVSVDAASRRTGFSKNIVAMRYAKLQNKNNKE